VEVRVLSSAVPPSSGSPRPVPSSESAATAGRFQRIMPSRIIHVRAVCGPILWKIRPRARCARR